MHVYLLMMNLMMMHECLFTDDGCMNVYLLMMNAWMYYIHESLFVTNVRMQCNAKTFLRKEFLHL